MPCWALIQVLWEPGLGLGWPCQVVAASHLCRAVVKEAYQVIEKAVYIEDAYGLCMETLRRE